ncbi:MAG: XRE family transcriptional regulator [Cytophagia bacterium]|nr:XRE family transcriptional regulator [Cytophagia bacterium]
MSLWCSLFRTQYNKLTKAVENFWKDQKAFAFDCEIGRNQLHMIENGKTNPCVPTLIKIAKGLEISLSKLVDLT